MSKGTAPSADGILYEESYVKWKDPYSGPDIFFFSSGKYWNVQRKDVPDQTLYTNKTQWSPTLGG